VSNSGLEKEESYREGWIGIKKGDEEEYRELGGSGR
jgi:hypothetical protein